MRARRAMPNRDDEILPDKNCGFTIGDAVVLEMGCARHHKQLVAINVDLRQLVRFQRIFNRKRMKSVVLLELFKLQLWGLEQSDPDKFGFSLAIDRLVQ